MGVVWLPLPPVLLRDGSIPKPFAAILFSLPPEQLPALPPHQSFLDRKDRGRRKAARPGGVVHLAPLANNRIISGLGRGRRRRFPTVFPGHSAEDPPQKTARCPGKHRWVGITDNTPSPFYNCPLAPFFCRGSEGRVTLEGAVGHLGVPSSRTRQPRQGPCSCLQAEALCRAPPLAPCHCQGGPSTAP